jgi:serine/threonine protein kinase
MNPIVDQMLKALKEERSSKILQFGDLKIVKELNHGQQGIVVKARNLNGKIFAIKFYAPSDTEQSILEQGKERFMREAKILVGLRHCNIVAAYAYGSAKFDKDWSISNDFSRYGADGTLYYIMDYVKGDSVTSLFYKRFIKKTMKYESDPSKGTQQNLNLFEELASQVSDAMAFFHEQGIVHRDIKPDNIIYSNNDNTFIVVDFGFAKHFKKYTKNSFPGVILRRAYLDKDTEERGLPEDELFDQCFFASMLSEILEIFRPIYPRRNYEGIKTVLNRAIGTREQRYSTMRGFKTAIERYLCLSPCKDYNFQIGFYLVPSSRFGYFDQKLRIPFSGSVPLFAELTRIIDTKDFQRLRGVRQLGPTYFVYPGATHTRFEHSIGTFFLSLKYLETLLKNIDFLDALEDTGEGIKLVVLSALLHDIGHYPYSHWIEEIDGLPPELGLTKHEVRAKEIILAGEVARLIRREWQVDPESVCKLIQGGTLTAREELLRSIIDSAIDADKVDYLQRDSAHCGVPYGFAFDVERLISSLWISEERNKICLTEKARSSFAALIMSNVVMYQEVYWHKTTRACTAMFKRFFFEFVKEAIVGIKTISDYLLYSDERFIQTLYTKTKNNPKLRVLIQPFAGQGRVLYKPGYVHYPERGAKHGNTVRFFEELARRSYPDQVELTNILIDKLKPYFPSIMETDIILETAPVKYREVAPITGFKFYDPVLEKYEGITPEIADLNRYLQSNRRSYIFCRPEYYDEMRKMTKNGKLNEILGAVNEVAGKGKRK